MNRVLWSGTTLALLLIGCSSPKPTDPVATLKASMDRYAAMKSFHTTYAWKEVVAMSGKEASRDVMEAQREIWVQSPDQFKVVSKLSSHGATATYVSVSSGKDAAEYLLGTQNVSAPNATPAAIHASKSMIITHPMFCGSPINAFFGGSANYAKLVDSTKGAVKFGAEKKLPNGKNAHEVKFAAVGQYGNITALIGNEDHLVYAMSYDNAGMIEQLKGMMGGDASKYAMDTTETYDGSEIDPKLEAKAFDTTLPAGVKKPAARVASDDKPPVPLGKPAPNFTLTSLDGKTAKLSDYRGKVVMVDAWATWCGPCKRGLPTTQKLHDEFKSKGLVVMAVSDETADEVSKFVKENKFTFPTYVEDGSMRKAYKISAIPTLMIIDAEGNLSSYSVGLEPESTIREMLKKAGLKS